MRFALHHGTLDSLKPEGEGLARKAFKTVLPLMGAKVGSSTGPWGEARATWEDPNQILNLPDTVGPDWLESGVHPELLVESVDKSY